MLGRLTLYCPMMPYGVMTFVNSPQAYGNLYEAYNTRRYTLVRGFCFFWLILMGCKELTCELIIHAAITPGYSSRTYRG